MTGCRRWRGRIQPHGCRNQKSSTGGAKKDPAAEATGPECQREADQANSHQEHCKLDKSRCRKAWLSEPADCPAKWIVARREPAGDEDHRGCSHRRHYAQAAGNPLQ
jgi:hypothetical protein